MHQERGLYFLTLYQFRLLIILIVLAYIRRGYNNNEVNVGRL